LPDGGQVRVLKVLMTNVCEKNCYYCAVRARRDVPRTSFTPDELAAAFDRLHRADLVDGLFLSSGVCAGPDNTMDRMIACIELVRQRYQFQGYVHLKLLPGASQAHVERAVQLAHRVSVNLEAPNAERLAAIAPRKNFFDELSQPMWMAKRLIDASGGRLAPAGLLPRKADPKMLYARAHPELFPIEVNRASREELLRVPGIGPRSVSRLLQWRRQGTLRELEDVKRAGAVAERAAPYVLLDGRRPPHQLPLWDEAFMANE
ncbi:MAG: radical SAM protein, partial [Anaerolineae bacterium]